MNVILIGTNGAGKTTMATRLYKDGYHMFREAPMGNHHAPAAMLCMSDLHIVFDRWNVIDRLIYEEENQYLDIITMDPKLINRNNVIIYLQNDVVPYDGAMNDSRSVQRPSEKTRKDLDKAYYEYTLLLSKKGIMVYHVKVFKDVEDTYRLIKSIIKCHVPGGN